MSLFLCLVSCAFFIIFLLCLFCFFEIEHNTIDAISQPGWRRAVVKHMAKVRFTAAAHYLCSLHAMCIVGSINNTSLADRFIKTGPSASAFKFCIAFKEGIAANGTIVRSYFGKIFKLAAPGHFSPFFAGNMVHVFWQDLLPLIVTQHNF